MTTGPLEAHVTCKCNAIKFSTKASYPQSRCKHAACLLDSYMYLFAGKDKNISLRDFWRFNIGTLKWEVVTFRGDPPHHLEGHTLVSCKKLLLLFGGEFGDALTESSLWIINPDLGYIRKAAPDVGLERPCIRRYHSAIVYNGAMYVYGGYVDMKGSSSEMWRYLVDEEEWELLSPRQQLRATPGGRHGHTAVVYNKHMWLYGGSTDLATKQDFWSYSFGVHRWDRIKYKYGPPALVGHSSVVVGTRMFIFGGEINREPSNQLWYFCFKTQKWTQLFMKDQIPPRTFHSALLVTPASQQDNTVKASSVPHLQKKLAKLNLERPRSSPGVRPDSSGSNRLFQKSGSQDSLLVDQSVSSRRNRSGSHEGLSAINSTNSNRPNVLNLQRETSEDGMKLEPSPAENTEDKSPLCPHRTDFNYNAIDMLDKNTVNCGIDNPGISDSTEELIRESISDRNQNNSDLQCDINRPSPFERSLSYMTEAERHKNLLNQSSETLVTVISGGSCESLVSVHRSSHDPFSVKRTRLDPDLVLEDIEYSDCFPHNIQVPFPKSARFPFSSFKSAESLLTDSQEPETIVLENYNERSVKPALQCAQVRDTQGSVTYSRNSDHVEIHGLNAENGKLSEKSTHLGTRNGFDSCPKSSEKKGCLNSPTMGTPEIIETSFREGEGGQQNSEQPPAQGIYRKNPKSQPKNCQSVEPPFILIVGGKDNTTINFGIKPLPVWKIQINSLSS